MMANPGKFLFMILSKNTINQSSNILNTEHLPNKITIIIYFAKPCKAWPKKIDLKIKR